MTNLSIKRLALLVATLAGFAITGCNTTTEPSATSSATTAESLVSNTFLEDSSTCLVPPIRFKDTLQLTDDQVAKLQAAEDSLRAIEKNAIDAANGDRAKIRAAMDAFRDSMKAAVESILTADQLALLKSLRPRFDDRDNEGCHGRNGGAPDSNAIAARDSALVMRLATDLALTSDQITQIQALQAQIRTNHPADPRAEFYNGLKTILTADQLTKLDALIAAFPPRNDDRDDHGRGPGRGPGDHH